MSCNMKKETLRHQKEHEAYIDNFKDKYLAVKKKLEIEQIKFNMKRNGVLSVL